jgi:hypothetical protein
MRIHTTLTPELWFKYSLLEQLANVGMDIERTIRWKSKGNQEYSEQAFERAMELLDLTIEDSKNKKGTRKELVRVREALKDHFLFDNEYRTTDEFWQSYFYDYAYADAIARGR